MRFVYDAHVLHMQPTLPTTATATANVAFTDILHSFGCVCANTAESMPLSNKTITTQWSRGTHTRARAHRYTSSLLYNRPFCCVYAWFFISEAAWAMQLGEAIFPFFSVCIFVSVRHGQNDRTRSKSTRITERIIELLKHMKTMTIRITQRKHINTKWFIRHCNRTLWISNVRFFLFVRQEAMMEKTMQFSFGRA